MKYDLISSSSNGNCLIIEDYIAIDMGVSYSKIKKYVKTLKVVLLTHIHSDHFNKSCIRRLAFERPKLLFVCGSWLVNDLVELGVKPRNIIAVFPNMKYDFNLFDLTPIQTYHDVKNMSYIVDLKPTTLYYATDTNKLDYYECLKNLDYYFIEANYSEDELRERLKEKQENGEYSYEYRVLKTHLSKEECNRFLITMMGENSQAIYCHQHIDKEIKNGTNIN